MWGGRTSGWKFEVGGQGNKEGDKNLWQRFEGGRGKMNQFIKINSIHRGSCIVSELPLN